MPEEYKKINIFETEEEWLHYYSTTEGRHIVIFTTRKNLELLAASRIKMSDDTFKISPLFSRSFIQSTEASTASSCL